MYIVHFVIRRRSVRCSAAYEHRRRLEQIAERIVQQVEYGAGVQVGKANDLTGEERLPRSCDKTQYGKTEKSGLEKKLGYL